MPSATSNEPWMLSLAVRQLDQHNRSSLVGCRRAVAAFLFPITAIHHRRTVNLSMSDLAVHYVRAGLLEDDCG
jgi:hypothetical protein